MRLHNFLDFETKDVTREKRLALILQAARPLRDFARGADEKRELEFVYDDCQAAMSSLPAASAAEHRWVDRRIERMVRVLDYYEGRIVRLNRRYWWVFFATGLALLLWSIFSGAPSDPSAF